MVFLFLTLVAILVSGAELCNYGRGHKKEHFCEIILNLGW